MPAGGATDPWEAPATRKWMRHVLDEMEPKLSASAIVMSLVPKDRYGDVKFWVELGASIMMDKPIIAVVIDDAPVPSKLALIADEVVRVPKDIDAASSDALQAALRRVMAKVEESESE